MANLVKQVFTQNGSITFPGGVTQATINTIVVPKRTDAIKRTFGPVIVQSGTVDAFAKIYAWGLNTSGQLGDGTLVTKSSPVLVAGGLSWAKFASVNDGINLFGLTTAGILYTWGTNSGSGGSGNNLNSGTASSPVLVVGGLTWAGLPVVSGFSNGADNSVFALTPSGTAYSWGQNNVGQLGDGTIVAKSSPVLVLGGLTFTSIYSVPISSNNDCVFGLTPTGALYSWGFNTAGQLGDGTQVSKSSPVAVLGGLTFASFAYGFAQGNTYLFGLTTAGALYAWGTNAKGQLGDGTTLDRSSPVLVLGGLTFASVMPTKDASSTGPAVFALTTNGTLYAWGANNNGKLGDGTIVAKSSPTLVLGGLTFASVFESVQQGLLTTTVFGLTPSGTLYGWGSNIDGQIGDGTTTSKSSPVAVLGGLTFSSALNYASTVMGITASGLLYSWGGNTVGQLGDGTAVPKSSPVLVLGGLTWSSIAFTENTPNGGTSISMSGVTSNGAIYSWGSNTNGQLGDSSTTPRSSPVLVVGGLAPALLPTTNTYTFSVVPGTAYSINFGAFYTSFGQSMIGQGPIDQVIVSYEQ